MIRSGQARLAMYDLIFNRPLCDYPVQNRVRVLILGDGPVRTEAFQACFSLGQSGLPLEITVAGADAEAFGGKMLMLYPDLDRFAREEGWGALTFRDTPLCASTAEAAVRDLRSQEFGYIIIACEDKALTKALAAAAAKRASQKTLIAVGAPELTCSVTGPETELYAYGLEAQYTELFRLAKNINFAYEMKYNQRVSRSGADASFDRSVQEEFYAPDNDFIGANYSADSSLSCAAHIPTKLAFCLQQAADGRPAEDILKACILEQDRLYHCLVELEHRRWTAYMALRGFRAPTPEEEQRLLYRYVDGRFNDHRDMKHLIHICMCTSGTQGVTLGSDDRQWDKDPSAFSSPLDRASVRAYRLACAATEKLLKNKNALLEELDVHDPYHSDFRHAVEKLLNDDCNSLMLYENAMATALENCPDDEALIRGIDRQLRAVKCRNKRIDFISIDAELIDFLPFCLWYRKKYKTVLTLTTKNPIKDVVVPTILCGENAVFIGPDAADDQGYRNRISSYFSHRGSNTNAAFVSCDVSDIAQIRSILDDYRQQLARGEAVLNLGGDRLTSMIDLAAGMFLNEHTAQAVCYSSKGGIVTVSGDPYIAVGLYNKSFSVSEVIELIGGFVKNPYSHFSCESDREKWAAIFEKYCCRKTYKKDTGENAPYNTWIQMSAFFQSHAKGKAVKIYTDANFNVHTCSKTVRQYRGRFDRKVFDLSGMDSFLNTLEGFKIIANYTDRAVGNSVEVSFDYCEPQIVDLLEKTKARTRLQFSPEDGIKYIDMRLDDAPISTGNDHSEVKEDKKAFIKALVEAGFLTDYFESSTRSDGAAVCSFSFKDPHTHWLLRQQGAPYEEVIYHFAREYGQFDDVQTGVKIAWSKDANSYGSVLAKKLEKVQSRYGSCGYYIFKQATLETKAALSKNTESGTDNEIDVIAVKGMTPIFFSAKSNKDTDNGWIYEVQAVSAHFGALPVMVVAHDCDRLSTSAFAGRAAQMQVSLMGAETMWHPDRLQAAFATIANGEILKPKGVS